jgi:hypothetical protein
LKGENKKSRRGAEEGRESRNVGMPNCGSVEMGEGRREKRGNEEVRK